MPELSGGSERIDLGSGYALIAPALRGRAEQRLPGESDLRAAHTETPLFADVLAQNEMATVATIEIEASELPGQADSGDLRDSQGQDVLVLETPYFGEENGQVVLATDEAGTLSWHFPETATPSESNDRDGTDKTRFLIRRRVLPFGPEPGPDRALFGAFGRKVLRVIVYPISDLLLAKPAQFVAEYWESRNRPYLLRDFSPQNYRERAAGPADQQRLALTSAQANGIANGRSLLFLHGTFSNTNSAFHDLPPDLIQELGRRYDGRMFAFDHYTLSHDPRQNTERLLSDIGSLTDRRLEVDIVCHSRGGLVARALAEGKTSLNLDIDRILVRRIVFAAVPNRGTLLANPDHMVDLIDRLTNALNLVPPGSPADVLEGILIAVKVIGHGALTGLTGLHAMHPESRFLAQLNSGGRKDVDYLAIAADYRPTDVGLRSLVSRSADAFMDCVFETAANDLVVPEDGVYAANGYAAFPIAEDRCLRLSAGAGVMHTTVFKSAEVQRQLDTWLR